MKELADLLIESYSAENAAALAYLGHAESVKSQSEKAELLEIVREEIMHRERVLRMMRCLQLEPSFFLEIKFKIIGKVIGLSCHVIGWFMPMYFAGRLESGNVREYLRMAELVKGTTIEKESECLFEMAQTEKRHEIYFLNKIRTHPWAPLFQSVFQWGPDHSFNQLALTAD